MFNLRPLGRLLAMAAPLRRLAGPALQADPVAEGGALAGMAEELLSPRGETSGVAVASALLDALTAASEEERLAFCTALDERFGPELPRLDRAIERYRAEGKGALPELVAAAEPRRQELLRRLNQPPGAIARLLELRAWMLRQVQSGHGPYRQLDADFVHLFTSWFNRGFLRLEQITWDGKASVLEKLIRYEAVHDVRGWDDLRGRLQPADRRCFGFFHPALDDEPLIFVEVALTRGMPAGIGEILGPGRNVIRPEEADTAVFYSISNCQQGLRGVAFGNLLIKQVVAELSRSLPGLATFATLSPVPGFMAWLRGEAARDPDRALLAERLAAGTAEEDAALRRAGLEAALAYFTAGEAKGARSPDPVAHFHLGNGAQLGRLNWMGDPSARGIRQAGGLMVNYIYDLDRIDARHEAYCLRGEVARDGDLLQAAVADEARGEATGKKKRRNPAKAAATAS